MTVSLPPPSKKKRGSSSFVFSFSSPDSQKDAMLTRGLRLMTAGGVTCATHDGVGSSESWLLSNCKTCGE